MHKKHISIVGSCVSRNLFNTALMKEVFEVDCYAFQRAVWDCFNSSFNLSDDIFDTLPVENFTARMLKYSINKTMIKDLEAANSEYLLIDLHNFFAKTYKLSYKDKYCYFQNTTNFDRKAIESFSFAPFNEMKIEEIKTLNEQEVIVGLEKFACWVKNHYDENKVIIYISKAAKKVFHNNIYRSYYINKIQDDIKNDFEVEKFSLILKQFIPQAILLPDIGNKTAIFGLDDDISVLTSPPSEHYSLGDQIEQSKLLLNLLGIQSNVTNPYYSELINVQNALVDATFELNQANKELLTLNNYFNKIENLNDVIIVISAIDESSKMLKYYRQKRLLNIDMKIAWRNSYVAIIDKSRNFVYEKASPEKISYTHNIEGLGSIFVESAGYDAGNSSIISINGCDNISLQKRGLNIVLLNSKTLELIDVAYCDTYEDKNLKVFSNYLMNIKIKT